MTRILSITITSLLLALVGCSAQPAPTASPTQALGATSDSAASLAPVATEETAPTEAATQAATPQPTVQVAATTTTLTPTPAAGDGLTPEQRQLLASLPSRGPAPELRSEIWLNSEPLRLAELRGRVVLLDMWTYG